jgi:hypothetical protein
MNPKILMVLEKKHIAGFLAGLLNVAEKLRPVGGQNTLIWGTLSQ